MRIPLVMVCLCALNTPVYALTPAPDNSAMFFCRDKYGYTGLDSTTTSDWSKFAACVTDTENEERRKKEQELWEFLEANPRYRVPGQSLNECYAKPAELALDRIETKTDGTVIAYYKDTIARCAK